MTSICTFTLTWNHGSTILIFDWIINWFFVSTGCHSWTKTSFSCVSAADNSKIIMEFVFCGFVLSMLWYAYRSCSFVMFLILAFWTMYDQLYCISWTIINYTGLIRNTICCWYLMMEASVHIISYVLHLDLSSSNKSYSSSVILLLHKHIQRITIAQCHSLVADTTLRWNVHLRREFAPQACAWLLSIPRKCMFALTAISTTGKLQLHEVSASYVFNTRCDIILVTSRLCFSNHAIFQDYVQFLNMHRHLSYKRIQFWRYCLYHVLETNNFTWIIW